MGSMGDGRGLPPGDGEEAAPGPGSESDVALGKRTKGGSKYDFVKVRVWLGENWKHYYVLSRFLLSRMLTAARVPQRKAIQIMTQLKKSLVDNNELDVSQRALEAALFDLMRVHGYGEAYVRRFSMIRSFYHQRIPLVVIVCGTACVAKSAIAMQLAEQLNLPNVLQTDLLAHLVRTSDNSPLHGDPTWDRTDLWQGEIHGAEGDSVVVPKEAAAALVREYQRECFAVRKCVEGDLRKAIGEGKSIILEGTYLDPGIYLNEFGSGSGAQGHATNAEGAERGLSQAEADAGPIFVPIVIAMERDKHRVLLEQWPGAAHVSPPASKPPADGGAATVAAVAAARSVHLDRTHAALQVLQGHLVKYANNGVKVVYVAPGYVAEAVEDLHQFILQCIESRFG